MGYKGLVMPLIAASRARERQEKKRQSELIEQQKDLEQMEELDRCKYEVNVYQNKIALLQTIHKECSPPIVWENIVKQEPLSNSIYDKSNEEAARQNYTNYQPTMMDKMFKKTEKNKQAFLEKIETGKSLDHQNYQQVLHKYESDYAAWKEMKEIASKILAEDIATYEEVINGENPFKEMNQLGSDIHVKCFNKDVVIAEITVHTIDFIPAEINTLLANGQLAIEPMPQAKQNEYYQDYACSCAIRVAREIFSFIPVKTAIVNVISKILNKATGHEENAPILSVAISKTILEGLNLEAIDPSDSMTNFVHHMSFDQLAGLTKIELLQATDFV